MEEYLFFVKIAPKQVVIVRKRPKRNPGQLQSAITVEQVEGTFPNPFGAPLPESKPLCHHRTHHTRSDMAIL
jgi:hypothetical protein